VRRFISGVHRSCQLVVFREVLGTDVKVKFGLEGKTESKVIFGIEGAESVGLCWDLGRN